MELEYASKTERSPIDFHKMYFYCLISMNFVCNLLIAATIAKSKNLRTRTNKMIYNFALIDSLYLLHGSGAISYVSEKITGDVNEGKGLCLMGVLEVTVVESSLLVMLLLLSNAIMKSNKISDEMLLTIYYVSVGLLFVMCATLCLTMNGIFVIFQMTVLLIVGISIACLLIKEVYRGYRYRWKRPLSKGTTFRMNVARTYIYSWLIFLFSFVSNAATDSLIPPMLFSTPRYVSSLTLLIYLTYSNHNFKKSLLELIRCRSTNTNSETAIQFENDRGSPQKNISIPAV